MSDQQEPKPKIIVDDNWKERVQAEKEALKQEASEARHDEAGQPSAKQAADAAQQVPPASFSLLLTTLATQALVGLGQIPDPSSGEAVVRPELAKHHIDMLGVLEEKTAGNLSSEEAGMLTTALHDLRMLYVAVSKRPAG